MPEKEFKRLILRKWDTKDTDRKFNDIKKIICGMRNSGKR
jgi:hypothetical protein